MSYKVAIVGATGRVGQELLTTLVTRDFPVSQVIALASERSAGKSILFGEKSVRVRNLATFDFTGTDIVLSSPGAAVSAEYTPLAVAAGCLVIDNTSYFRMVPDVPLVIPEVNPHDITKYAKRRIIANPNCSTIQMVLALHPLHSTFRIRRVIVSTYQSTSGAGRKAMDELSNQTKNITLRTSYSTDCYRSFTKRIACNLIPHIDSFMDDGSTREEWKMSVETQKILGCPIPVHANCCRVPVFIGHAEYINIETELPISEETAKAVLSSSPGIVVIDSRTDGGYMTPAEVAGKDDVYISRIRRDFTVKNGLSFWCVADNIRKGAALNAVQIAELLIRCGYLKR